MHPADALAERLGLSVNDRDLLAQALIHSSWLHEHPDAAPGHNERLEFLGDAVVSLAVSEALYRRHPADDEGVLSARRAAIVSTPGLARLATRIDLGPSLQLGEGEAQRGGRVRPSLLASAFEALIGAIYLDRGFVTARRILARQFATDIRSRSPSGVEDCKTRLQEITQKLFKATPTYTLVMETGPDHAKHFVSQISVGTRTFGRGEGRSKKSAEQAAAMEALEALRVEAQEVMPRRASASETGGRASDDGAGASRASSGTRGQR